MSFQSDEVFDLLDRFLRFSARKIDLIDDGDQLEIVFEGEISIGERLRFNSLRSVHDKQRTFAGRE